MGRSAKDRRTGRVTLEASNITVHACSAHRAVIFYTEAVINSEHGVKIEACESHFGSKSLILSKV